MDAAEKNHEEEKRKRMWRPAERWQAIQNTLTWAEAQQKIPRNSRQRCLEEQARLNNTASRPGG